LVRLVPEIAESVPGLAAPLQSDPETERYRLFEAVVAWLVEVSRDEPVLLVLDDLQWAAKPTLLLLRHLVRSNEPLRLLIVGTYRDTELSASHPLTDLLADLHRDETVTRLSLGGLDSTGVVAYMEAAGGEDLSEDNRSLAQAIWNETEGNPFFVGEVLRHLVETGAVVREGSGWLTSLPIEEIGIPQGVREVVGRRLSRLSKSTNDVLRLAAVAGMEFEAAVVQAAGDLEDEALASALEEALGSRLVVDVPGPGPRNRFAHALVRATLYDDLSSVRRASLHRRVAEALELLYGRGPGGRVNELAGHWIAATRTADVAKAVDYARWAGEAALSGLAFEEAARWFSQALELLNPPAATDRRQHAELLIALGTAQRLAGDLAHRETLLEAARLAGSLDNPDQLVRAALANNRGLHSSSLAVDAERVGVLEAALAATATAGDSPERARLLATLAVELTMGGDFPHRRRLAEEAIAMARRLREPETLARVLNLLFFCLCVPETLAQRLETTAESVAIADQLADPALQHWSHRYRVYACAEAGDIDGFDAHLPVVEARAAEVGDPSLAWAAAFIRGGRAIVAGDLAAAEELTRRQLEIGTGCGMPEAAWVFLMQMLAIRGQQGRLAEMEEPLVQAVAENPRVPVFQAALACLSCELGNEDGAREILTADAADAFAGVAHDFLWLWALVLYAESCAHLRDQDTAQVLYQLLSPWNGQFVFVSAMTPAGAVSFHLGRLTTVLGRSDDAEAHFAQALTMHERQCAPYWIARTQEEWEKARKARR